MAYIVFVAIGAMWGTSFILMDRALLGFGPVAVGMGRMLIGAATLAAWCMLRGEGFRVRRGDWPALAFVAFSANAWPFAVQPYVMRAAGEHAFFGMIVTFGPLFTILASIPLLGKRPTPRQIVGVVGGLACFWLVLVDGVERGINPWHLALSLTVPCGYAVGNVFIKRSLEHLAPAPLSAIVLALAGLMLVPLQLFPPAVAALHLEGPTRTAQFPLAVEALVVLGVMSTGVAVLAFNWLVVTQGPLFAAMVGYLVPITALVWGQLDGERLTAAQIAAMAGVLSMVALVQWGSARPATAVCGDAEASTAGP